LLTRCIGDSLHSEPMYCILLMNVYWFWLYPKPFGAVSVSKCLGEKQYPII
jgi:hypothetical protein